MSYVDILDIAVGGHRVSVGELPVLWYNASLTELGWAADVVCRTKHPERYRTYVVDRNINYTNICVSGCKFCAFYRKPWDPDGYVLSVDEVLEKVREAVNLGATQIMLQGGLHPLLRLEYHETLFSEIKQAFDVWIHSLSAPEIVHLASVEGMSVRSVIERLARAGLNSIPGGGAEILDDSVRRRVSPEKCSTQEWLSVMRCAAELGLRATATMVIGLGESVDERVAHLDRIRRLQDETDVFTAFIPWTFQPSNTKLGGETLGGHEYLATLALSRLFLDNFDNVQASWVTQGNLIAQLALRFGANDLGGTMIEEKVVAAAGAKYRLGEAELISLIHNLGYDAAQRSTNYELIKLHPLSKGEDTLCRLEHRR